MKFLVVCFPLFKRKVGKYPRAERKLKVAHIRNAYGILYRAGNIFEFLRRLVGTDERKIFAFAEKPRVADVGAGLNGEERRMRLRIVGMKIVRVLRADDGNRKFSGECENGVPHLFHIRNLRVVHDFKKIVFLAENVLIFKRHELRAFGVAALDCPREFAPEAPR